MEKTTDMHVENSEESRIFTYEEMYNTSKIFSFLYKSIGLESKKQVVTLLGTFFIPFFIFIPVTIYENRFWLGSLNIEYAEGSNLIGMSFIGDPMVWPFCFFVPITLLLTKLAIKRSTEMLNEIGKRVNSEWKQGLGVSAKNYVMAITKAKTIFSGNNGWIGKIFLIAPWIIGLTFWGYNTVTCAFHDFVPFDIYPYKVSEGMVINQLTGVKDIVNFSSMVAIPKWDTNLLQAPLSTISARVWTIFYYGAIPFILVQIIRTVHGSIGFLLDLRKWEKKISYKKANIKALDLNVFDKDGFGGLGLLAETGMSHLYAVSGIAVLVTMSFFKEGTSPSWHNYLLIFFFLPLAFIVYLIPPLVIRDSILELKDRYITILGEEMNQLTKKSLNINSNTAKVEEKSLRESMDLYFRIGTLKTLYQQINEVKEWPFNSSTLVRIFFSAGLPFLMIIMDKIIESFIL